MTNDIETLIRETAPRVTRQPEAFLAALGVGEEAAATRTTTRKRRRTLAVVGAGAVLALAGTTAAAAATQSLWWTAPHEVVAEAQPLTGEVTPVTQVGFILSADYAAGVDGSSAAAQSAFQLAQQWLAEHPVVVPVPSNAQTLTEAEREQAVARGIPPQVALENEAIAVTRDTLTATIAAARDGLESELAAYLTDNGADPALIVVDGESGVYEVGQ